MSSRALKKLAGKSLEDELKKLNIDVEKNEASGAKPVQSKFSAFAFLNEGDEEEKEDEGDEEKQEVESVKAEAPTSAVTKKKSKKKKKAKKSRSATPVDDDEEDNDDIDKILAEVKQQEAKPKATLEQYDFEDEYDSTRSEERRVGKECRL